MSLIVQKFGGTSVADPQKILAAARKAIREQQAGHQVVTVVSAMGHSTDHLIELAEQITENPPAREMDMLLSTGEQVSVSLMAMAAHALGHKAVSLTGAQIGIRTDSTHTKARIHSISTERMQQLLDEGNIVIAAGFQGIDENFNITTLGRGGSDTTAVSLAAVLGADSCDIYTDVDGIYTTDPRVVPEARRLSRISYDEMLELASLGAGVMHSRSIEFAKKFDVAVQVRSSFTDAPGTLIVAEPESHISPVCGAALNKDEARITLVGVPDVPDTSHEVFSRVAARNITVDMIVQNIGHDGKADISFTVPSGELRSALDAIAPACEHLKAERLTHDNHVAKISVVGLGMAKQSGVADRMFGALAAENINIQMITTSEIKISVLVMRDDAARALRAVHQAFALEKTPADAPPVGALPARPRKSDALDVVSRLQGHGMEGLSISDIALDLSQARVTLNGLPDTPGVAAQVFAEVARAGIFVDMIVQSFGDSQRANLTFTVPGRQLQSAVSVVNALSKKYQCDSVSSSPFVAKLSVSGIGLRSHTGVGARMFQTLAEAGLNVEMVSTSEVRVNVVVDGPQGEKARACLERAFADVRR